MIRSINTIPGVQNESIAGGISVDGASGAENVLVDWLDTHRNFHLARTEAQRTSSELLERYQASMGFVHNAVWRP